MVVTNFKQSGKPARRAKEGKNEAHLSWLRTLPCIATLTPNAGVAHHLLMKQLRGMGKRAPDWFAVPLRPDIHVDLHKNVPANLSEEAWFSACGIERADLLAGLLWQCSGDLETAETLIERWKKDV